MNLCESHREKERGKKQDCELREREMKVFGSKQQNSTLLYESRETLFQIDRASQFAQRGDVSARCFCSALCLSLDLALEACLAVK